MGKIFYIMGKSSSGKDTVYKELLENKELNLKRIILYTTRPIRDGEVPGREYHFVDEAGFEKLLEDGKIIEYRIYQTVHGAWHYFTADDGQIEIGDRNYLGIGTLESYRKLRKYYGEDKICPIYIEVEDGERLLRAISREQMQKEPKYAEMCRRFLADTEDFSEENIKAAEIEKRFLNIDFETCMNEILQYIQKLQ